MAFQLSEQLRDFISKLGQHAGYTSVPEGYDVWHKHSTCMRIVHQNGEYLLGSYERNDPPRFDFSSAELHLLEKQIAANLGAGYRAEKNLPELDWMKWARNVKEGYTIEQRDAKHCTLSHESTGIIPVIIRTIGRYNSIASRFSYLAGESLDDIIRSFLSPSGGPLFEGEFLDLSGR